MYNGITIDPHHYGDYDNVIFQNPPDFRYFGGEGFRVPEHRSYAYVNGYPQQAELTYEEKCLVDLRFRHIEEQYLQGIDAFIEKCSRPGFLREHVKGENYVFPYRKRSRYFTLYSIQEYFFICLLMGAPPFPEIINYALSSDCPLDAYERYEGSLYYNISNDEYVFPDDGRNLSMQVIVLSSKPGKLLSHGGYLQNAYAIEKGPSVTNSVLKISKAMGLIHKADSARKRYAEKVKRDAIRVKLSHV